MGGSNAAAKPKRRFASCAFLRGFKSPRKAFRSVDAPREKRRGMNPYPALRPSVSNHKGTWMTGETRSSTGMKYIPHPLVRHCVDAVHIGLLQIQGELFQVFCSGGRCLARCGSRIVQDQRPAWERRRMANRKWGGPYGINALL